MVGSFSLAILSVQVSLTGQISVVSIGSTERTADGRLRILVVAKSRPSFLVGAACSHGIHSAHQPSSGTADLYVCASKAHGEMGKQEKRNVALEAVSRRDLELVELASTQCRQSPFAFPVTAERSSTAGCWRDGVARAVIGALRTPSPDECGLAGVMLPCPAVWAVGPWGCGFWAHRRLVHRIHA